MRQNKLKFITYSLSQLIVPFMSVLFIISLLLFSKTAFNAALDGIKLWLWVVFPALFPFFVSSEILNSTGFVRAIGIMLEPIMRPIFNVPGCGSFALAMGISSGYPVGAKITSDMRNKNMITKVEAERLLCFTNNSGPLFMAGAVAVGMYGMPILGVLFLVCHYLACITVGIIFRFYKADDSDRNARYVMDTNIYALAKKALSELLNNSHKDRYKHQSFGTTLGETIRSSTNLIILIGGFIIVFSVIVNVLINSNIINIVSNLINPLLSLIGINKHLVPSIVSGFLEVTAGTNLVSKVICVPLIQQLAITSFIMGWAGISVHCQVISIVSKSDISVLPYFLAKFLQGIFASIYTVIFVKFTHLVPFDSHTVFQPIAPIDLNYAISRVGSSIKLLVLSFIILLCGSAIAIVLSRIFGLFYKNKTH